MKQLVAVLAGLLPVVVWAQTAWDFEDAKTVWRPRSDGVTVQQVTRAQAPAGKFCLQVSGRQNDGWNYAMSEARAMTAGQAYRLTAWLCVGPLKAGTAAPALKCEFVSPGQAGELGRAVTPPYNAAAPDTWQKLEVEFIAPAGTTGFWLALEKNGNTPMELQARLDDVVVEPIAELSITKQYALDPLPAPLQRLKGIHPRLYLQAADVERLRAAAVSTHAAQFKRLQQLADRLAKSGPPAYVERDRYSGEEQLYQREVGNAMPTLALVYLLTGESRYLEATRAWALASCSYPTWGLGSIDGMDLAAGHQLFGLALVYDWCYRDLGEADRKTIRDTLVRRAGRMYEAAAAGRAWWQKSYLQNHLWVNTAGMAAAGLALYDEEPTAAHWIGLPLDKFRRSLDALGSDGASHEGAGYWQYGVEYLLKFMVLARDLLAVNLFDHPWWRNTAYYALYLQLPRQAWTGASSLVDLADCPRGNWYGPEYLLRLLAHEYGNPYAQWQADEEEKAAITAPGAPWLNLLWYDPQQPSRPPSDLPTLRLFEDLGIVSARSDWSGRESLVVFKCGPFIGHEGVRKFTYDPGGGHVHPDANHLLVFGQGEWLLRDDGYANKLTGQHNTLLIAGKGQVGEGTWFDGGAALRQVQQPRIVSAASQPDLDHLVGDATGAYPVESGLQSYRRHLLFVKPDVLLVLDDVATAAPKPLELRFHPEQQQAEREGQAFICRGRGAVLRLEPFAAEGVTVEGGVLAGQSRDGKDLPLYTVRLQTTQQHWRQATALSWSAADEPPPVVKLQADGDNWTFTTGRTRVVFVWGTQEARVAK